MFYFSHDLNIGKVFCIQANFLTFAAACAFGFVTSEQFIEEFED